MCLRFLELELVDLGLPSGFEGLVRNITHVDELDAPKPTTSFYNQNDATLANKKVGWKRLVLFSIRTRANANLDPSAFD